MSEIVQDDPFFRRRRRAALSHHPSQVGIDYVEIETDPQVGHAPVPLLAPHTTPVWLTLHLVPAAEGVSKSLPQIGPANIRIRRGDLDATELRVLEVRETKKAPGVLIIALQHSPEAASEADVAQRYSLELVGVPGLDPFFARVDFSLEVGQPARRDPKTRPAAHVELTPSPEINYLAKDYSSFRQLMLDRLSVLVPRWEERHPADLTNALVEVLAYAADYLSYYQDAVATEAYLSTARRRISIRRHARLIDYKMHEGCNARAWVQVQVGGADKIELPPGIKLLTRVPGLAGKVLDDAGYRQALNSGAQIFETMHLVELYPGHNRMPFYTWGAREFVLAKGCTSAVLRGHFPHLRPGQVLIFQEVIEPTTAATADADPEHCHAVRLTEVIHAEDALGGGSPEDPKPVPITEIHWHAGDALPFPLTISTYRYGAHLENVSVARGNIALVDHGRTLFDEALTPAIVPASGPYRPRLGRTGLTYRLPYDHTRVLQEPAAALHTADPRQGVPAIQLFSSGRESRTDREWVVQSDLLATDRLTRAFVVEMESDGRAQLRFGDGVYGRQPPAGAQFRATYRIGNGPAGNVGRQALAHIYPEAAVDPELYANLKDRVVDVCNPLAAWGGTGPEPIEQVRLHAPRAFHRQERCVVEADYVAIAGRHPQVRKATASLRWTGGWYTVFIAIHRHGSRPVDSAFREEMLAFLEPYRPAGYDVAIRPPRFVPLDIQLKVGVAPTHVAYAVKQTLLDTFSNIDLPDGRRGFFHPDQWTLGQPVYKSQIIALARQVPGVIDVNVERFGRWREPADKEIADVIHIGPTEIARVHNDDRRPQHGTITFEMEGSR
jgi:hypothetical protein